MEWHGLVDGDAMRGKIAGIVVLALGGAAFGQVILPGGGPVVTTTPIVNTLTTGSVLDTTATVSADGRYVVMQLHPQFSALTGMDTFTTPGGLQPIGNGIGGGVNGVGLGGGAGAVGAAGGAVPALGIAGGFGLGNGTNGTFRAGASQGAMRGTSSGSTMVTGMVGQPMYSAFTQQQNFVQNFRQNAAGNAGYRPSVVGNVTFVENDKTLLSTEVAPETMKDKSLKQAIRALADETKKNLVLGNRAFEQAGVDVNKPHTFVLGSEQGTLKAALLAILNEAAPGVEAVITAEDNVVQVTTQASADNQMITKIYYLEDLMARIPRIVSAKTDLRTMKEDKAAKPTGESLGGMAVTGSAALLPDGAKVPEDAATSPKPSREIPLDIGKVYKTDIVELLTSTVRPEIWKNHGGKYAEITVTGNRVMVRAPASVHAILDGPSMFNPNAAPKYLNYSP